MKNFSEFAYIDIDYISRKMDYANYGLRNSSKELNYVNKKLLFNGLMHLHLVYGLPMWGFARKAKD